MAVYPFGYNTSPGDFNTQNKTTSLVKNDLVPRVTEYAKNYLVYPCSKIAISQTPYMGNHLPHTTCNKPDYPWDEYGGDTYRSPMYCPCDEMVVTRLQYQNSTNVFWLESTKDVYFADGTTGPFTLMVIHPWYYDDLCNMYVNKKYTRGQLICYEGADGNSSGNHFHFSAGKGRGGGWTSSTSNGSVVLTLIEGSTTHPKNLFYIDTINKQHDPVDDKIGFKELSKEQLEGSVVGNPGTAGSSGGATITQGRLFGIDVSYANIIDNYQSVKNAGVNFAIIRAGGSGYENYVQFKDSLFEAHYDGFKNVGIPMGAYFFSSAITVAEAELEADYMINLLKDKEFEYPIYIDMESPRQENNVASGYTKTLTDVVITFCKKLKNAGYAKVGVYTNTNWLRDDWANYIDETQLTDYLLWLAEWNDPVKSYTGIHEKHPYTIHQYGKGKVSGIRGDVDLDWSYVNYMNPDSPITSTTTTPTAIPRILRSEFLPENLRIDEVGFKAPFDFDNKYMFALTTSYGNVEDFSLIEDLRGEFEIEFPRSDWWYENNKREIAWMGSCIEVFQLKIKKGETMYIHCKDEEEYDKIFFLLFILSVLLGFNEMSDLPDLPDSSQPSIPEETT